MDDGLGNAHSHAEPASRRLAWQLHAIHTALGLPELADARAS